MAYTHSKNCAHRDLKLENILLDKHNNAKLSDFGFTREYSPPSLLETICGTTCYMAPEMLMRKKYSGESVDVWSLGVLCYTLIYGEMPFEEDSDTQTRIKVLTHEPTYPDPQITGPPLELLKLMLSKDPRQRPTLVEILSSPWLGAEGEAQLEILNEREYLAFTSKPEQRLLRTFRAAQFDTEAIRESVTQSKCDPLAGTWALALRREFKIENRRLRHRTSSHHRHHQQCRNSINVSRYSLTRNDSTNSRVSILRKQSTSSRRSSSISRVNSFNRHSQQVYLNQNASTQGSSKPSLDSVAKKSNTNLEKVVSSTAATENTTKELTKSLETNAGLISPPLQDSQDIDYIHSQHQYWHSTDDNESISSQDKIKFPDTFSQHNNNADIDNNDPHLPSAEPPAQRPVSDYNPNGSSATKVKSHTQNNSNHEKYTGNHFNFKDSTKRTIHEILRGSFHNNDTTLNRSSISLPISETHNDHANQYSNLPFIDVADHQNPCTNVTFMPVPQHQDGKKDQFSEEMSFDNTKKGGRHHGWGRLHSSSKSSHSTTSSSATNDSGLSPVSITSPDKKNKKFVTVVKNAWMKLVVPSSTINRKKSLQFVESKESSTSLSFGLGGNSLQKTSFSKENVPNSPAASTIDGKKKSFGDRRLEESKSLQNIKPAYNDLNKTLENIHTQTTKSRIPNTPSTSIVENNTSVENTPISSGNDVFTSPTHNDDTITSLLPQVLPVTMTHKPRQDSYASITSTHSRKSSTASGKNYSSQSNTTGQILMPGYSHSAARQRPISQISQFSTVSGISQISGASSQLSSNYEEYSFSELSSINVIAAAAGGGPGNATPVTGANGVRTPRRHHSTGGTGGNGSSGSQYLRRPYMRRRSTSSSFSSLQSANTSRGLGSNVPNPGTNGSTFMKSHRPSHSKASSLSSISIHSGFSSAFPRDEMMKNRNRSDSSPLRYVPGSGHQGESSTTGDSLANTNTNTANTSSIRIVNNLSSDKQGSFSYGSPHQTHHRHRHSNGGGTSSSSLQFLQQPSSSIRMTSPDSSRSLYSSTSLLSLKSVASGTAVRQRSAAYKAQRKNSSSQVPSLSRKSSHNNASQANVSRTGSYGMSRGMSRGSSSRRSSISSRTSSLSSLSSSGYRRRSLSSNGGFVSGNEGPSASSKHGDTLGSSRKFSSMTKRRSGSNVKDGNRKINRSNSDLSLSSLRSSASSSSKLGIFSGRGNSRSNNNASLSSGGLGYETIPRRPGSPFISQRPGGFNRSKQTNESTATNSASSGVPSPSASPTLFSFNSGLGSKFSRAVRRKNETGQASSSPAPPISSYRRGYSASSSYRPSSLTAKIPSRFGTSSGFSASSSSASSRRLGDTRMPGSLLSDDKNLPLPSSHNSSLGGPSFARANGGLVRQGSIILEGEEEENGSMKEVEESEEQ